MSTPYPSDPSSHDPHNQPGPPPGIPGQPGPYGQPAPQGQYGYPGAMDPNMSDKSKLVAGILGILLGGFGIHQFYLGNTQRGLIQLVVTFITCGIGAIWGFIEGILYLIGSNGFTTDAQGRPLQS